MELVLALALVSSLPAVAGPTGIDLEPLVDSSEQLPGTTEPIFFDGPVPVPCGDGVAFRAFESGATMSWAYYFSSNGAEIILDEETLAPGTAETFEDLAAIRCIGSGRLIFPAKAENLPGSIYDWSPGVGVQLVQSGDVTVGGQDFGSLVDVGASGYGAGILGRLSGGSTEALMVKPFADSPVFAAAEGDTILPGQGQPTDNLNSPAMAGSDLYFRARTPPSLAFFLYRWSADEAFSVAIDQDTSVPGSAGTFDGVGQFAVLSTGIAFAGGYDGGKVGIFLLDPVGQVVPLVRPGDETVGGETVAAAFNPTGSGGLIAFRGWTEEMGEFNPSVFVRGADGQVRRILGQGDMIGDETVLLVNGSAHGNSLAVRADQLADSSLRAVIYRVGFRDSALEIPTISDVGLVVFAALVLVGGVRSIRTGRGAFRGRGLRRHG